MQVTERNYNKMQKKLRQTKEHLENALTAQRDAQELGDLRENTEYETARQEAERLMREVHDLEESISNAEIVAVDNGPRICIGSLIEFYRVDSSGNKLSEVRRVRLEEHGDTVMQKVLGVNSSLGKAIINGTDGMYTIPDNGGINYIVHKVIGEDD